MFGTVVLIIDVFTYPQFHLPIIGEIEENEISKIPLLWKTHYCHIKTEIRYVEYIDN